MIPSSELNPKHTWKLNFNDRVNFLKLSKKAKLKDIYLIQHAQFMDS